MHDDTVPDVVQPRKRRKGIYILPNLFTLAALVRRLLRGRDGHERRFDLAALGVFAP
jgi:CDP-diacylglycerol--serine O-phosphatidyltransferase